MGVRQMDCSQDEVTERETSGSDLLLISSSHAPLIALGMMHGLQSVLVDQIQLDAAIFNPFCLL